MATDRAAADALASVTSARVAGHEVTVAVEVVDANVAAAIGRARVRTPGVPIGFAARSETEALDAITSGADEALVLAPVDTRHALLLLERTVARAALRKAQENERTSIAHSEKLAALGTVVAGVAHEINNPLAAVLLSLEALKGMMAPLFDGEAELRRLAALERPISVDEIQNASAITRTGARLREARDIVDEMASYVQTIADVVRDLRIYARSDDAEPPQIVQLPDLIEQVVRIVGREISARGHIERDYASDLPPAALPRARIVQVITNILINAAHAIRDVERPVHRVRISLRADDEYFAISISDTGPGIAAEHLERIFDPFFTTKREGVGTGLGLSISRSIMRRLGGDLIVESVHGVGATFIALVPVPDREALRQAYMRSSSAFRVPASAPVRRAAVLVVDDDDRLLRTYPRILRERYDVIVASDGQEAIDLVSSGSPADVVLTDLQMPEVDGRQLHAWLAANRPELAMRTIFVTSSASAASFADFLRMIPNPVLEKPVSRDELVGAIDAALSVPLGSRVSSA